MRQRFIEAKHAAILAELNAERADAMARLGQRVADGHVRYVAAAEALETTPNDHEIVQVHRLALHEFQALRWEMTVHREALGLHDHSWVDSTYPLAAHDRRHGGPTEAQQRLMRARLLR